MKHGDFTHVEIPADDAGRAKRFYGELFNWQFLDLPDYPDYHMFTTAVGEDGAGGAIGLRKDMASDKVLAYVKVDSIDATVDRLQALGGSVKTPKGEVPGQGWYAVVLDSEGNEIALWESLPSG